MIQAVEIIRERQRFRGYIHLKIMPGQPPDYIEWAVQLADRVSINLEAPTPDQLARIAPKKDYWRDLVSCMEEVRRLQGRYPHRLRAARSPRWWWAPPATATPIS
jgi:predicted DNA-binding helix-hairpin-helix protein